MQFFAGEVIHLKGTKIALWKNKVLSTWIISYIMIMLVALITNSYIYWSSYRTIEKNIEDSHIFIAKELQADMDGTIQVINGFASKLFLHPSVKNFFRTTDISSFYKDFSGISAFRSFNELMQAYIPYENAVSDYYLVSFGGELVWNNSAIRTMDYFSQNAYITGNDNLSKLMSAYHSMEIPDFNRILPLETVTTPANSSCMLYYPLSYSGETLGYMAVLLDDAVIKKELEQLSAATSSCLYILDENKNILYANNPEDNLGFEDIELPEMVGQNCDIKQNNENYMLYTFRSDNSNLYYLAATPRSQIYDSLADIRRLIIFSIATYLIISSMLIAASLHKNYKPLRKVREIIESHESDQYYTTNDYDLILYTLAQNFNQKKEFRRVLEEQAEFILAHHLNTMLKVSADYWKISEDSLMELEEKYFGENYAIFLFLCDMDDQWKSGHPEVIANGYSHFFETEIKNVLSSALGEGYLLTETDVDDFTAFIVKIDDDRIENWKSDLKRAISMLSAHLKNCHELNSYYAVSTLQHSILDCTATYSEVLSLLSNVLLVKTEDVLYLDECEKDLSCRYVYTLEMEERFCNSFKIGTRQIILSEANSIWEQMSAQKLPWTVMYCFCLNISSSLIKVMQERKLDNASMEKIYDSITPIIKAHSVPAQKKAFFKALEQAIDLSGSMNSKPTVNKYLMELERLLSEHIYDENLNISFLADEIGINSKYLSAVYRETYGISLLDAIHKERINYVKELLEQNVSIQDAACQVGYGSTITLNRWFKKYEGITPNQYRSIKKEPVM